MTRFPILPVIQILVGLLLIADYFYKPGLVSRLLKRYNHRVDRILILFGGIILVYVGARSIFPELIP